MRVCVSSNVASRSMVSLVCNYGACFRYPLGKLGTIPVQKRLLALAYFVCSHSESTSASSRRKLLKRLITHLIKRFAVLCISDPLEEARAIDRRLMKIVSRNSERAHAHPPKRLKCGGEFSDEGRSSITTRSKRWLHRDTSTWDCAIPSIFNSYPPGILASPPFYSNEYLARGTTDEAFAAGFQTVQVLIMRAYQLIISAKFIEETPEWHVGSLRPVCGHEARMLITSQAHGMKPSMCAHERASTGVHFDTRLICSTATEVLLRLSRVTPGVHDTLCALGRHKVTLPQGRSTVTLKDASTTWNVYEAVALASACLLTVCRWEGEGGGGDVDDYVSAFGCNFPEIRQHKTEWADRHGSGVPPPRTVFDLFVVETIQALTGDGVVLGSGGAFAPSLYRVMSPRARYFHRSIVCACTVSTYDRNPAVAATDIIHEMLFGTVEAWPTDDQLCVKIATDAQDTPNCVKEEFSARFEVYAQAHAICAFAQHAAVIPYRIQRLDSETCTMQLGTALAAFAARVALDCSLGAKATLRSAHVSHESSAFGIVNTNRFIENFQNTLGGAECTSRIRSLVCTAAEAAQEATMQRQVVGHDTARAEMLRSAWRSLTHGAAKGDALRSRTIGVLLGNRQV